MSVLTWSLQTRKWPCLQGEGNYKWSPASSGGNVDEVFSKQLGVLSKDSEGLCRRVSGAKGSPEDLAAPWRQYSTEGADLSTPGIAPGSPL